MKILTSSKVLSFYWKVKRGCESHSFLLFIYREDFNIFEKCVYLKAIGL